MVCLKSRQKNNSCSSSVGYFYGVKFFNPIKSGCFHWPKVLKAQNLNFNGKFNRLAVQRKNKFIVGKILMASKTMYVNIVKILCPI